VAPCSSCYTVLAKTNRVLRELPDMHREVNEALAAGGLSYGGKTAVRHPLDILMNDVGLEAILARRKRSLAGIRVAPYYGCQIVRPEKGFDDRENPMLMDRLFQACGAGIALYPVKVRCCGGMLMTTFTDAALKLCMELLSCARENDADLIVTTCPLCHFNLEAYQSTINARYGTEFALPILYFTQLLGIVFGIEPSKLGLDGSFIPLGDKISSLMEAAYV
jgi:heterodisulfide reductase subunit B